MEDVGSGMMLSHPSRRNEELVKNAELLALQRLDGMSSLFLLSLIPIYTTSNTTEKSVNLQRTGRYMEALECMERGLVLRQHFFGSDSDEVWNACKTVGELCNMLAMTYLQQGEFRMAEQLLNKAAVLHQNDDSGLAVTYNNLACFYRRKGKLRTALKFLNKTLKIEAKLPSADNPGDTHLNMCAVLSQLGRHEQALEHAQSALILLQEELFSPGKSEEDKVQKDRLAVLAIAYHNIGVEQEYLKQTLESIRSYQKGVEIATAHLGSDHGIAIALRNSLVSAQATADKKKKGKKTIGTSLPPIDSSNTNRGSKRRGHKKTKKSPSSSPTWKSRTLGGR